MHESDSSMSASERYVLFVVVVVVALSDLSDAVIVVVRSFLYRFSLQKLELEGKQRQQKNALCII